MRRSPLIHPLHNQICTGESSKDVFGTTRSSAGAAGVGSGRAAPRGARSAWGPQGACAAALHRRTPPSSPFLSFPPPFCSPCPTSIPSSAAASVGWSAEQHRTRRIAPASPAWSNTVTLYTLEAPPPDIPRLGMSGGGAFFLRPNLFTYSNSANAAIFTFSSPVPPRPLPTWGSNPFSRDCLLTQMSPPRKPAL